MTKMHHYVVAAIYVVFISFVYYLLNLNLDEDSLKPEKIFKSDKCFLCLDKVNRSVHTSCGHEYCGHCIIELWQHNWSRVCPACRTPVDLLYPNFRGTKETRDLMKEIDKFNSYFVSRSSLEDISRYFQH